MWKRLSEPFGPQRVVVALVVGYVFVTFSMGLVRMAEVSAPVALLFGVTITIAVQRASHRINGFLRRRATARERNPDNELGHLVQQIKAAVAGFVKKNWPLVKSKVVAIYFLVSISVVLGLAQAIFAFGLNPVLALVVLISLLL